MAPVNITADEFANKLITRTKGATEDIRRGIERVTESPTAKAAAKKDKMLAGIQAAVNSGKWAAGLNRVTLEDWKKAAIDKGVSRIGTGLDNARTKIVAFAQELIPHIEAGQNKIKSMPDLTLEDNINRAATMMRHMSTFKRTK